MLNQFLRGSFENDIDLLPSPGAWGRMRKYIEIMSDLAFF